ncbi:MGMT family protein [Oceaniserpentilla sp. 4NH20-0058]|uniref:MGMT family protein n=1 Tax=Oceaniserpentilla sp. 4NH20-0058 TaxID=3127660 RepID=UPI00310B4990
MGFDDIIYLHLIQIPSGHAVSYGYLARMAGYPNHARQVGRVLKHLPQDTSLPWYRVVNAQGKISFEPESVKFKEQLSRLQAEGASIRNNRIIKPSFLG